MLCTLFYSSALETAGIPRSGTRTVSARQARVHSKLSYKHSFLYAVYIISYPDGAVKIIRTKSRFRGEFFQDSVRISCTFRKKYILVLRLHGLPDAAVIPDTVTVSGASRGYFAAASAEALVCAGFISARIVMPA